MDAYEEQAALARYSDVPISGGEIHSGGLPELRMMIERRCYDIFQPDAMFTGGIAQTMEVARLVRDHGLAFSPHTWSNGIGFAVNLHIAAAAGFADEKDLEYPLNPPGWVESARDGVLTRPFQHVNGEVEVPTRPGLGVDIDPKALRRHGKRFFAMNRAGLVLFALRDRGLRAAREIDAAKKARAARKANDS